MKKTISLHCLTAACILLIAACGNENTKPAAPEQPQSYQVFDISPQSTVLNTDYPATLQGEQNIEIRPKVDGFVDKIYVDEGAVVKKNQLLFKISAPQYQQDLNNATAAISSAEADVSAAELQVNKTKPLVEKDIISHYELESAQYTLQARKAALLQARTALANAKTNVGYTLIYSPVNGVVGSLPYKIGSLVSSTNAQPLTTVSNIGKVYAYFSLNEKQLLFFSRTVAGKSLNEKLKNTPAVTLVLADGTPYPEKGRVETISGLLNTETGSASFRAGFPNPLGLIRSGGSATVRIPEQVNQAILVPQKSTYELQSKRFVYRLDGQQRVRSTEINIMDLAAGQYYVVTSGLKSGDRVVYDGTSTLKDSTIIKPELMQPAAVFQDAK